MITLRLYFAIFAILWPTPTLSHMSFLVTRDNLSIFPLRYLQLNTPYLIWIRAIRYISYVYYIYICTYLVLTFPFVLVKYFYIFLSFSVIFIYFPFSMSVPVRLSCLFYLVAAHKQPIFNTLPFVSIEFIPLSLWYNIRHCRKMLEYAFWIQYVVSSS